MKGLLALPLALALSGQSAVMDLDAIRSRAQRYAGLAPAARAEILGQDLSYAGLHPEPLPGGHFLIRFPGPHLGEDPDVIAVPLDWAKEDASGARASAALVDLARVLKTRHFRPRHVLWLLWANEGGAGMEALIQSQEHQGKLLAHVLLLEGGWEGLATASEGLLALDLGFGETAPAPDAFRAALTVPAGVDLKVERPAKASPAGAGLSVLCRTSDAVAFAGLQDMIKAAVLKAGGKTVTVRESIPPGQLPGGPSHPLAVLAVEQGRRAFGAAPGPAGARSGALAVLLAHRIPALAMGLGPFEGARPADLLEDLATELQNLP